MLKKIKTIATTLALLATIGAPALIPASTLAVTNSVSNNLCAGTNIATGAGDTTSGCNTSSDGRDTLTRIATQVVNLISLVVGVIAVIMIIVGGFKYITSGGESSNVSGAKNTLIYAIVGLIIVALAQFIVRFVLGNTANIG